MSAHILKNRRGSTLIMVLIVFALLVIFATAALAIASNSQLNSVTDYQSQQAYFTARSSVLAAVDYFKNNPGEDIKDYVGVTGTTSNKLTGMGEYWVTVTKLDDIRYQIASTATFGGKTRTERAIVKRMAATPFKGLAIVSGNGGPSTFKNDTVYRGDIYIGKNSGSFIFESIRIYGNLYIDNEGKSTADFQGKVLIYKDPSRTSEKYNGALLISGNAKMQDWAASNIAIAGGVYIKGNLTGGKSIPLSNIHKGADCPSDISFTNNSAIITDTNSPIYTNSETFSSYPSSALTVVNNGKVTIKGNLELSPSTFQTIANFNPNECVIDTSAKDIYIKLKAGNYSFEKVKKMSISGDNNVYVYFDDKSSPVTATIRNGAKYGDMACVNSNFFDKRGDSNWVPGSFLCSPKMTIISANAASSISVLTPDSDLYAFVYMPNGKLTIDQNANFAGSFACSSVDVGTQCHLAYIPPKNGTTGLPPTSGAGGGIELAGIYTNQ